MKHYHYLLAPMLFTAMQGVYAQTTAESDNNNENNVIETTSQETPSNNVNAPEEIVVYGEKQEKSLQDTPVSVGVLTQEQLDQMPIMDFNDVYNRMANVSAERGGNESLFTIRGVSVQGLSDNPNSYTAGVYIDDVALDNLSIRYGVMGVWDVQQIEIYRGPQSTLQGRNALNGAIHIKTNDPTFETTGSAQVYAGSYNTQRISVAGGTSIIDDVLAFRVSVDDYSSDGYVDNITRDEDDYAGFDRRNIRGKLLFQPSDSLSAQLMLSQTKNNMGDNPNVRVDDPYSFEALSDYKAHHNIESDIAALNISYDINENLTLTSISTLAKDEYDRADDWDSTENPLGTIDQIGDSKSVSEELRLNFNAGNWSGIAGVYYGEIDRNNDYELASVYPKVNVEQTAYQFMTAPPPAGYGLTQGQADMIWSFIPDLIDIYQDFDSHYEIENIAIFGETTWQPNNEWAFTLGARYDREKQKRDQQTVSAVLTDTGEPNSNALLDALEAQLNTAPEDTDTDYHAFLPKAAVQYFWTDNINTGFTVQKGYRAGGTSVNTLRNEIFDFDPEYTWNYELSLRSILFDGSMMLNANMFYTDWKDQQVDVSPSGDPRDKHIGNAGESSLQGLEIETTIYATDALELFANAGYVKTKYKEFTIASGSDFVDYKGNEFKGAPKYTAAAGFNYSMLRHVVIGMDANYQGSAYLDNENTRKSDARTLLNAKVGYQQEHWGAYLWATNITDKEYIILDYDAEPGIGVQDYATPGAPRMLGVSLHASF